MSWGDAVDLLGRLVPVLPFGLGLDQCAKGLVGGRGEADFIGWPSGSKPDDSISLMGGNFAWGSRQPPREHTHVSVNQFVWIRQRANQVICRAIVRVRPLG